LRLRQLQLAKKPRRPIRRNAGPGLPPCATARAALSCAVGRTGPLSFAGGLGLPLSVTEEGKILPGTYEYRPQTQVEPVRIPIESHGFHGFKLPILLTLSEEQRKLLSLKVATSGVHDDHGYSRGDHGSRHPVSCCFSKGKYQVELGSQGSRILSESETKYFHGHRGGRRPYRVSRQVEPVGPRDESETHGYHGGSRRQIESASQKLQDPNFIWAYAAGVVLVRPGKRPLHPEVAKSLSNHSGGWHTLRECRSLRVARWVAGLAITSPSSIVSGWGRSLRGLAADTPHQLSWLRSSQLRVWLRHTAVRRGSSPASLARAWADCTAAREILVSSIQAQARVEPGICRSSRRDNTLWCYSRCSSALRSYGS